MCQTLRCSLFLTITRTIGMASSKGKIANQENSGTEGVGVGISKEEVDIAGIVTSSEDRSIDDQVFGKDEISVEVLGLFIRG